MNWYIYPTCNYECTYCFCRFNGRRSFLEKKDALSILEKLKNLRLQKITYSGGEPLLYPFLGDLLIESKSLNMTTMIITNGSLLTRSFLVRNHDYIDWIGLSLDSSSEMTQLKLKRGFGNHVQNTIKNAEMIKEFNIKLKINTVLTNYNYHEDMSEIIKTLNPKRWKIFQVLKVEGENEDFVKPLLISERKFMSFVNRHRHLNPIYESNDLFRGSYVMLDSQGRFFQNTEGYIEYSNSILEVDPLEALAEVGWNSEKFLKRGGIYDW